MPKHLFTSAVSDDADATLVRPSNWNATHITGITSVSSNTTLDATHDAVLVTNGAADDTITLPAASGISGRTYFIMKVDTGAGNTIIDANASELIDEDLTLTLTEQYQFVVLVCDGSGWQKWGNNHDWGRIDTQFTSNLQSTYLTNAFNKFKSLNASVDGTSALVGVLQSNTTGAVNLYGLSGGVETTNASGTITAASGFSGTVYHSGAGTVTDLDGGQAWAFAISGGGNITRATGLETFVQAQTGYASTITSAIGLRAKTNIRTAGTVTTNYGIKVEDQGGVGTTNFALHTGTGTVHLGAAFEQNVTSTATGITLDTTHRIVLVSDTATITLPTAASVTGRSYIIKNITTGGDYVTISTTSSQTIDGWDNWYLGPMAYVEVASDGTNWAVINKSSSDPFTTAEFYDDMGGEASNIGQGFIGSLGWRIGAVGAAPVLTQVLATGKVGVNRFTTSATSGQGGGPHLDTDNINTGFLNGNTSQWKVRFHIALGQTTTCAIRAGLMVSHSADAPTDGIWVRYDTTPADTTFVYETRSASTSSTANGASVDTNWHTFEIQRLASGNIKFSMDGANAQTLTTNIPTGALKPSFQIITRTTATKSLDLDWWQMICRGLTR